MEWPANQRSLSAMTGGAVEDTDWECLSTEVYSLLFSNYGSGISAQSEPLLLTNINRLVVRQRNTMACVVAIHYAPG